MSIRPTVRPLPYFSTRTSGYKNTIALRNRIIGIVGIALWGGLLIWGTARTIFEMTR